MRRRKANRERQRRRGFKDGAASERSRGSPARATVQFPRDQGRIGPRRLASNRNSHCSTEQFFAVKKRCRLLGKDRTRRIREKVIRIQWERKKKRLIN